MFQNKTNIQTIKLFFNPSSPIISYNYTAFIGGVLLNKSDAPALDYYMSNHLLLLSNRLFDINCDDLIDFRDKTVFLHKAFPKTVRTFDEIKELLIKNLLQGYYASVTVNELKLSKRWAYNKVEFHHDILIYGFDLDKNIFYTAGYDDTGYFSTTEHPIDLIINSMIDCFVNRTSKPHAHFFKPNMKETKFDLLKVKESLNNYLISSSNNYNIYDAHYGLDAYNNLISIISDSVKNEKILRKATFHMLYEHKKLMLDRLKHMKSRGISFDYSIIENYQKIVDTSKLIELLYIKYSIKHSEEIIKRIIDNIKDISALEENLFKKLLKEC